MVVNILKKFIGDRNTRQIRQLRGVVARINELEPQMAALTDTRCAKTIEVSQRLEWVRHWMRYCPSRLPWCARPPSARLACATSMCS